jgi:DNA-binding GntR family transcriptional regulator
MPVPTSPNPLPAPVLRRQEAERRLREAILRAELEPGERLIEDELAAWLGVSRTPVREALARLASEGLVVIDSNRGARVAPFDPDEVRDLVELSRELVLLAQRLAASRATDEEIRTIRSCHDRRLAALAAGDGPGVEAATRQFHMTILAASRNRELQRIYPILELRLERVFRLTFPEWLGAAGAELDEGILVAIEGRDPVAVVAASSRSWDLLEDALRTRGERTGLPAAIAAPGETGETGALA